MFSLMPSVLEMGHPFSTKGIGGTLDDRTKIPGCPAELMLIPLLPAS